MAESINNQRPWLITPEKDLIEEDLKQALTYGSNLNEYIERNPFPGATTSIKTKMKWYYDMHEDFCADKIATPEDAAKYFLWYYAPQQIRLDVVLDRKNLESLHLDKKEEHTFSTNFPKYVPKGIKYDIKDGNSFDECKKWILNNAKIQAQGSDKILFACMNCSCDDKFVDRVHEILTNLGLGRYAEFAPPEDIRGSQWMFHENDKIAECMYGGCEEGDPNDTEDDPVHYMVEVKFSAPRAKISLEEETFSEAHQKQSEKFKEMGDKRTYVLVRKGSVSQEEGNKNDYYPLTAEYYDPLWLPFDFRMHCIRISNHINHGEGESILLKTKLNRNDTDSSNTRIEIFRQELFYCSRIKDLKKKLGAVLALTYVISMGNNAWLYDNERYKECGELITSLANLWKTNLLKNDNNSLGIGLPDEEADKDSLTHSHRLLYQIMDGFAKTIEDCKYIKTFDWKPEQKKSKNVDWTQAEQKRQRRGMCAT